MDALPDIIDLLWLGDMLQIVSIALLALLVGELFGLIMTRR